MRLRRKPADTASVLDQLRPGESLVFSGHSVVSRGIRLGTCSPYSHVGVVALVRREVLQELYERRQLSPTIRSTHLERWGDKDRLVMFEATTLCTDDCLIMGRPVRGVQCHEIAERAASYDGRVWRAPLVEDYRLNYAEENKLAGFLLRKVGTEYDDHGAIKAGFRALIGLSLQNQDMRKTFCDALAAEGLKQIQRFPMDNVGKFTPGSFVKKLQYIGVYGPITKRERIK